VQHDKLYLETLCFGCLQDCEYDNPSRHLFFITPASRLGLSRTWSRGFSPGKNVPGL